MVTVVILNGLKRLIYSVTQSPNYYFIEKTFIHNSHTLNICSVPSVEGANSETEIPINFG